MVDLNLKFASISVGIVIGGDNVYMYPYVHAINGFGAKYVYIDRSFTVRKFHLISEFCYDQ
jgi:hypothetical protein